MCIYVYKSGKQKGQTCALTNIAKEEYCKKHLKYKKKEDKETQEAEFPPLPSNSNTTFDTIEMLSFKLLTLDTTIENKIIITKRFRYLEMLPVTSVEYHKNWNWLRYALNFPYNKLINTPVTISGPLCEINDYVSNVYRKLDDYIYGMRPVKEELMTFVCKRISNPESENHILALHGQNGVGKTRLAHGLAHALDLPIKTINLGCVNEVSYFTGHSYTYVDAEPGRLVQILNEASCKNCIIYFDELDKVHQNSKGQSIFAFLTHLIDPSQNSKYQDMYLSGLNLDMSKVFFLFSFNDETLIDKTVKDRLKIISIANHSEVDQIEIANKFIIPEIKRNLRFDLDFALDQESIRQIVKKNENSGLRFVEKTLENVFSKLNVVRMLSDQEKKKLSFYDDDTHKMVENILKKSLDKPKEIFSYYM